MAIKTRRIVIDTRRIKRDVHNAVADQIAEGIPAYIGSAINQADVHVPLGANDQPNWIYIHDIDHAKGTEGQALNSGEGALREADLVPGRPILVKSRGTKGFIVAGTNPAEDPDYIYGVTIREQPTVPLGQLDIGLLQPTNPPSMYAVVGQGQYTLNGHQYIVPQQRTRLFEAADIAATEDQTIAHLVIIDPTTGELSYDASNEFAGALDLVQAFPSLPQPDSSTDDGKFIVGWILFAYGATEIGTGAIIPGQEFLSKNTTNQAPGWRVDYNALVPAGKDFNIVGTVTVESGFTLTVEGELYVL